jgi:hypothetical protein
MKKRTRSLIILMSIIFLILFILAVFWIIKLQIAHSTFDNYYKFRGCTELINKTDDYGFCKINSGQTVKIVKYNNKWYLDGDLPSGSFPDW